MAIDAYTGSSEAGPVHVEVHVDQELYAQLRHRAIHEGRTVGELCSSLLHNMVMPVPH